MSTQQAVTPAAIAARRRVGLVLTGWFWLAGVILAAICGLLFGGAPRDVAAVTALALAPVVAGFILLPKLGRKDVDATLLLAWAIAGGALVSGTGGIGSPLTAALFIAPALALALGRRWAPEAGAVAVLTFALAAWLARFQGPSALGAFPEVLCVVSIAFACGLLAISQVRAPAPDAGVRLAEASHELRTPLTHILGFAEMIERRIFGDLDARYVEYAGLIRQSGNHLLSLVNDVLDTSRIKAGRYELSLESFDARSVVEEVVRMSGDSAGKKAITLQVVAPEGPLPVRADPQALRRMLINIVGNAIKFTPQSGRVTVRAEAKGDALVLETEDTGPGIPETERGALGKAYARGTAGARVEGTGLGLSLVRALAKLHGGTLSFHDAPGGGALVRITLPVLAS